MKWLKWLASLLMPFLLLASPVNAEGNSFNLIKLDSEDELSSLYAFTFKRPEGVTCSEALTEISDDRKSIGVTINDARDAGKYQNGELWILYEGVGSYYGKKVNVKETITGWEYAPNQKDANGHWYTGFIGFSLNWSGDIFFGGIKNVTVRYDIQDEDGNPFPIKGHLSITDIDGHQGVIFEDNVENVYYLDVPGQEDWFLVDGDEIYGRGNQSITENDKFGWLTFLVDGNHFQITFDNDHNEQGIAFQNIHKYFNANTERVLFGFSALAVAAFSTPEISKNAPEEVMGDSFTYDLYTYIPIETYATCYSYFDIIDDIDPRLTVTDVRITDDISQKDMTSAFEINNTDNHLVISAISTTTDAIYNKDLHVEIDVKADPELMDGKNNIFLNKASVDCDRGTNESNEVTTKLFSKVSVKVINGNCTGAKGTDLIESKSEDKTIYKLPYNSSIEVFYQPLNENYSLKSIAYNTALQSLSGNEQSYKLDKVRGADNEIVVTYDPIKKITVEIRWEDENDRDGLRPDHQDVSLMKENEEIDKKKVLKEDWKTSFIVKKPAQIKAEPVNGYTTEITQEGDHFIILNKHVCEKIIVKGIIIFDDQNNKDKIRPETVEITLLKNGEKVSHVNEKEKFDFGELYKYENGKLVNYTIDAENVKEYSKTIDDRDLSNIIVTYKHVPRTIPITGDHSNPSLYVTLMIISLIGLIYAGYELVKKVKR